MKDHSYDDIINLPRHVSAERRAMKSGDRAAQFSPFSALTGYDAVIAESGRLTNRRIELSEDRKAELDLRLQYTQERIKERPELSITYFLPDELKEGGEYVRLTGRVKKLDCFQRLIIMTDGKSILMDEVISMEGEFFDKM